LNHTSVSYAWFELSKQWLLVSSRFRVPIRQPVHSSVPSISSRAMDLDRVYATGSPDR
jgi:hypothetical protein